MEGALMLIVGQEDRYPPVEINHDGAIYALTFSANGAYLVSGGDRGVHVWQMEDGKETERMQTMNVWRFAISQDDKWIAAGTEYQELLLFDRETFQTFSLWHGGDGVGDVDFSPDSSRLVAAIGYCSPIGDSADGRPTPPSGVWDIATRERALNLDHYDTKVAKYSPQGNRIATANGYSLKIWDSGDGRLILDLRVGATEVLWQCNDHLFVVSSREYGAVTVYQHIDASTGAILAEWPAERNTCIATPKHGEFIAYTKSHIVMIGDSSTRSLLGSIQHSQAPSSIALSPDGKFLAIGGWDGRITLKNLSRFTASILSHSILVHLNNLQVL